MIYLTFISVLFTSDVDAISPNDYTSQPAEVTLSFAPGDDEKMHTINIVDDDIVEGPEDFEVQLRKPDIGDLGTPHTATVNIQDDDCN